MTANAPGVKTRSKSFVGKSVLSAENVTTRLSKILDLEGFDSIRVEFECSYSESMEEARGMC